MPTDIVQNSSFIAPHHIPALGEDGLTLHEVASSLGIEFGEAKRVIEKNINDYLLVGFSTHVDQGPIRGMREVTSYALTTEDAKFFVAGYNNPVGKAYRRYLIQCEKVVKQVAEDLSQLSPQLQFLISMEKNLKTQQAALVAIDQRLANKERDDRLSASEVAQVDKALAQVWKNYGTKGKIYCQSAIKRQFCETPVGGKTWKDAACSRFSEILEFVQNYSPYGLTNHRNS